MVIGVLALQGDFARHQKNLETLGLSTRQVRVPAHLEGLQGLVLPGGESSTMLKLLRIQELFVPLQERIRSGLPTLATCAGLILLARKVVQPEQDSLNLLDVTVARNGYGRQIYSGSFALQGPAVPKGGTGIFIRAPRILRAGAGVKVLARRDADPVLVRSGSILGACFHPELQPEHFCTRLFMNLVQREQALVATGTSEGS